MSAPMLKICKPSHPFNSDKVIPIFIHPPSRSIKRIFFGDAELSIATMNAFAHPQVISHE